MNKTPISLLQEVMVQRKQCMPDYNTENCNDIPGAAFKCTVKIGDLQAFGYASTKKEAKQNAASKALELLFGFSKSVQKQIQLPEISKTVSLPKNTHFINYVGKLNEYASMNRKMYPVYDDQILPINGNFITHCNFCNLITEGYGLNKKESKQDAARKMLQRVKTDVILVTAEMESLKIDKLKNIEKLSEKILKTYEILSSSDKSVTTECPQFHAIPNLKDKATSLEELKFEMSKYNHDYTIETFQRRPTYIMMMKINGTNAVFMGNGETKDEALKDLFDSAIDMLSHGFSLNTTF